MSKVDQSRGFTPFSQGVSLTSFPQSTVYKVTPCENPLCESSEQKHPQLFGLDTFIQLSITNEIKEDASKSACVDPPATV